MKKVTLLSAAICCTIFLKAQNVGIGTTAPPQLRLHVSSITDSNLLLLENRNSLGINQNTSMYFKTGNYYTGAIKTIGAGNASARLGIFTFGTPDINGLGERISILDGGNVGIGTTTPTTDFDINGTFRVRGNGAAAGRVLTSDASGNATWQAPAVPTRNDIYTIGSIEFKPWNSTDPVSNGGGQGGAYFTTPQTGRLVAAVHLPNGARVTQIIYGFLDNTAQDFSFEFGTENALSSSYGPDYSINSSGAAAGWRTITYTPSIPITINNGSYSYYISAYATWSGSFNMAIKSAVIYYTY